MPIDPQIQQLLNRGTGVPDTHTLSVQEARLQYERRIALMATPAAVASVTERSIAGPGGPLRLRVYRPEANGPMAAVVFFHGSGFVLCSLDTHDGMCRNLAAGSGCVVISVDYRLAPEHPFPAGLEDCVHATQWMADNALSEGIDPRRLAVAGDSAGGTMAAAVALTLRDRGGPPLVAQLLIYPATDHYSARWPSYASNASGYGLTRETMIWFWDHYLSDSTAADAPYASPYRTASLRDLPPAFVSTAQYDPLRDEGEAYAARLTAAGVPTVMCRYDGMNHGFLFWVGIVDMAGQAMADACTWLREQTLEAGHSGQGPGGAAPAVA